MLVDPYPNAFIKYNGKKLSLKKLIYSSNIGIIVDDRKNAGSGHLVRTLNLADQLISKKIRYIL